MATRLIIICSLLCALGFTNAHAQGLRDSRGRDFWLAVPPNDHRQGNDTSSFLSLLFNCDQRTDVRIEARARDGSVDIRTFTVPGAAMWETRYSTVQYELRGVTAPNGPTADCEKAMPMSIHVTTTTDVTVYAVLRDVNTSDAWMSLPTDALGTSYRVSTYASSAVADTIYAFNIPIFDSFDEAYPSQFVIVASEDSTLVDIDLSVSRSSVANGIRRSVQLQRGQSYLVQARVSATRQNDDLTGTKVTSTKPIALLSSHYRAQVPILTETASRDCLVEQLQSTDTWGKHIIVPPLRRARDFQSSGPKDAAVCRIVADVDNTTVQVNGQTPFVLNAGAFRDIELTMALDVVSSQRVLVTIIDRSANRPAVTNYSGDPSLIVMPPIEQFLNAYRVANAEPQAVGAPVFTQHQITCVVPVSAVASLTIDGAPSPASIAIPGTTYAYVHMNVSAGQHEVLCDSAFGIVVYGYGPAESYGYTGGMAFERLYIPSVVLRVLDVEGAPGDMDTIYAVVDSISDPIDLRLSGTVRLDGEMMLNLSTFVPITSTVADPATLLGSISFGVNFDTLSIGDTVSIVPGWHTLGRDTVSISTLANILWTTGAGDTVDVVTTIINGRVITSDVCLDQQPRLFDPLPAVTTRERRYYDIRGRYVGTSLDGLPPGVYYHR